MRRIAALASLSCHMRKPTYPLTKRVGKSAFFLGIHWNPPAQKPFKTAGLIRETLLSRGRTDLFRLFPAEAYFCGELINRH